MAELDEKLRTARFRLKRALNELCDVRQDIRDSNVSDWRKKQMSDRLDDARMLMRDVDETLWYELPMTEKM